MEKPKFDEVFTDKINTVLYFLGEKADFHEENLSYYEFNKGNTEEQGSRLEFETLIRDFREYHGYFNGVSVTFESFVESIRYNHDFSDIYKKIGELDTKYCDLANRYLKLVSSFSKQV